MKDRILIKSIKKISMFVLLIGIILSNSFVIYATEGLNIETDSLKNNNSNSYKSITDIYQIPLFTEDVTNEKNEVLIREKEEKVKLKNYLFLKMSESRDSEEEFTKKINKYNLFSKQKEESKIKYLKKQSTINIVTVSIIVVLSILTAIFTTKYYKYKNKKEENYSEYKSYIRY
ncbi:hypothetical protein [Clostridium uliginosum]|uniref:Uncharacterized protein n=1 Tax=Clostridium uliginosum TaxID=119641 RepID=A0A1I1PMW3_9CLOT|nr:hypothetical protein [Clostridium uliginosum]SFD11017.1 hypothetical protein SAMN05421842_12022 [Clostridium uliginosum]